MEKRFRNVEDGYQWARDTSRALRSGDLDAIDMEELIDEVESIATGLERELVTLLKDLIRARLLLDHVPSERQAADSALLRAYGELRLLLGAAPSLRDAIGEAIIDEAYQWAREYVTEDHGLLLPDRCPLPLDRILEDPTPRLVREGRLT